jgi:photosystem II P680 reaction center D2 protein
MIFHFILFWIPQLDIKPFPHDGVAGVLGLHYYVQFMVQLLENTLFEMVMVQTHFRAFNPTQAEETCSMVD